MKKFVALVAVAALVAFAAPAFAANPFMDVPMNHWAYDAVSQLAARGIVTGYPDGAFKGEWKATRYEMASIVARALAYVDMNKASKEDLELLKKLVVEFKDELDALGVKVEDLDDRVAVLEEDIGGWKINGEYELRFRTWDTGDDENQLYFDDARIQMQKKIDDKVTWVGRLELAGSDVDTDDFGARWEKFYLDIAMPWDINLRAGRQLLFPSEDFLDNDYIFWDTYSDGFMLTKPFQAGEFTLYAGHEESGDTNAAWAGGVGDYFEYYTQLAFQFNEQFGAKLWGYMVDPDTAGTGDFAAYAGSLTVNFTPSIRLTGEYVMEDIDAGSNWYNTTAVEDSPNALHGILEVGQDVFGFTSLGVEYWDFDGGFALLNDPFANYSFDIVTNGNYFSNNSLNADTDALGIFLNQKWNETWKTFQRYVMADQTGQADVTNWTFGVGFNYTSNLYFELAYDDVDYDGAYPDNNMIQFKTYVKF